MAEKEYIERENFCRNICRCFRNECDKTKCPLFTAPAADVVEVVRCKDCKHFGTSLCAMDAYAFDVVEEGFCSYGERKTE